MRIVSLLPSATEIICELGLADNLVGVTHECDYPPAVKNLPKVTKTLIPHDASSQQITHLVEERLKTALALYSLDMPTLERLKPHLIVTQALCDVCAVAEKEVRLAACSLPGAPQVVNLEPRRLEDVFECMAIVGRHADRSAAASKAVDRLRERVRTVAKRSTSLHEHPRVILLEWIDPLFSCGHWSPELVRLAGGKEMIGVEGKPSRWMEWREIIEAQPEVMVIACCGFDIPRTKVDLPTLYQQPGWKELPCVKSNRVFVVDGSAYFSRPGPRLVESLEILAHALHPSVHPPATGVVPAERIAL